MTYARSFLVALVVAGSIFVLPSSTKAATAQWQQTVLSYFGYCWTNGVNYTSCPSGVFAFGNDAGWGIGLANPTFTVSYNVEAYKNGTLLTPLAPGADPAQSTVSTGDIITLNFLPHQPADLYWFGAGYSQDSPYGSWGTGAPPLTCDPNDYVGQQFGFDGLLRETIYIPLVVAPPTHSLTIPAGLSSCGALTATGNGGLQETCTVTATSGVITPTFNFGATSGTLYYRYFIPGYPAHPLTLPSGFQPGIIIPAAPDKCAANSVPMEVYTASVNSSLLQAGQSQSIPNTQQVVTGTPYVLAVPAQSIAYPLKVVAPTAPPNAPTISNPANGTSGASCTATVTQGQQVSLSVVGTDPSNLQIKYGIDWLGSSATPNEYVPATGYVSSGTAQTIRHTWGTPGTYRVRALTQNSVNTQSGWSSNCIVTVKSSAAPDLTAGQVTPTTALVGTPVTLTARVTNSGNATTGRGFTDLLQTATDATGANAKDIGTFSSVTLAAGASNTATFSYKFPAVGTTYVRVCADKSSKGDTGVIIESDESKNCTDWTPINVTPPAVNFCASPSTINSGDSSHLFWSSSDATSCVGNGFSTGGATQSNPAYSSAGVCNSSSSGGVPVSPLTDTAYGVTCCVNASNPATCGSASQTVIVTHQGVSISATPSRVPNSGGSATVNWSASNVKSCTITGTDGYNSGKVDGDSSNTVTGSNTNSSVTAQTTYQITCAMLDNTTITKRAVVNIAAKFNEF